MADSANNPSINIQVQNCSSITKRNSSHDDENQGQSNAKCSKTSVNGDCSSLDADSNEEVVQLSEEDLQLFSHQVAGHGTAEKGFIKDKLGHVCKPLQGPPKGTREVNFYQAVFSKSPATKDCYLKLQEFVPKFHGIACLKNKSSEETSSNVPNDPKRYLLLDDVLEGFKKPCVVDLKLGPRTWSPDASEAKIKQETSKYKATKFTIGICLTGTIYYDAKKNFEMCKTSREFCKTLNPESMKEILKNFFNHDGGDSNFSNASGVLLKNVRLKLQRIKEIFDKQKSFRLYGSSVLIAYDAEFFENSPPQESNVLAKGEGDYLTDDTLPLRVYMIDFAHFHPGEYDTVDENYLFGLENLLKIICDIEENK